MPFQDIVHTAQQNDDDDHELDDDDDDDDDKLLMDPAEVFLQRGAYLRQLREMERQDEEERRQAQEAELSSSSTTAKDARHTGNKTTTTDQFVELASGDRILLYESYLAHQRYYDDLKHVDYRYIEFGEVGRVAAAANAAMDEDASATNNTRLVIEQRKSLGKGGLVWDAAFILGTHVIQQAQKDDVWLSSISKTAVSVVELGCGTGICGMMIAKVIPNLNVYLTDLPELMPLLTRNVQRNFDNILDHSLQPDEPLSIGEEAGIYSHNKASQSPVAAQVLDWAKVQAGTANSTTTNYDVILGADVVASLYDPVALARTIHALAHANSIVYLTFKERLSTIHRQFENEIDKLFGQWDIYSPPQIETHRQNRNPDVRILQMRSPTGK
eukprot:scaffold4954_cov193-Amphora_coffeaeformis.AAC.4